MDDDSSRIRVRSYTKSSHPRLRWTPELHHHFLEAVQNLGGKYKATPKQIMQMMGVKGLKLSHIKSHLQTYRNMKAEHSDFRESMGISPCTPRLTLIREASLQRKEVSPPTRKFNRLEENMHNYSKVDDANGSSSTSTSKRADGIQHINIELKLKINENNVGGNLRNYPQDTSDEYGSCWWHNRPINLDLNMSSNFFSI